MANLRAKVTKIRYCTFCTTGHHTQCNGQAPAWGGTCECADQDHVPNDVVAAAMRLYHRPDPFNRDVSVEVLATEYRETTGAA